MNTSKFCSIVSLFIFLSLMMNAQVGIETDHPREPLTVKGTIHSTQDGFKFPDGSIQEKAAKMSAPGSASDPRHFIIMNIQDISGSFSWGNYSDVMRVYDFKWGAYYKLVPDSLVPTSPRIHKMVTVTKDFDRGSVPLIQDMVDANVIPKVELFFYETSNPAGPAYYSIVLEAVRILAIDQVVEHQEGTSPYYAHMEKISFAFETIEWIWEDGGISFQDHLDPGPPADGTTK